MLGFHPAGALRVDTVGREEEGAGAHARQARQHPGIPQLRALAGTGSRPSAGLGHEAGRERKSYRFAGTIVSKPW